MLKMMAYGPSWAGGSAIQGTANYVLNTDLVPKERCIKKNTAISSGAAVTAMDEWEISQKRYGNTYPFPTNRLMPASAIYNSASYEGFAELYDDVALDIEYDRTGHKYDSYIAGYSYEVTDITFVNSNEQSLYGNDEIEESSVNDDRFVWTDKQGMSHGGTATEYKKGWARIRVRDAASYPDILDAEGVGKYSILDNIYHHLIAVGFADYGDKDGVSYYTNTGNDRSVIVTFRATKLTNIPEGVVVVPEDKTHTEFQVVFYHRGQNSDPQALKKYTNPNTLTLTHTASTAIDGKTGDTITIPLDLAVTMDGSSTNGTYWDETGWVHNSAQTSDLGNAISIEKTSSGSSLTIDWTIIYNWANTQTGSVETPIIVYGCWDTMYNGGTEDGHMIGNYNIATTVSDNDGFTKTVSVKSAGNLLKTINATSITKFYTPMYKITWTNDPDNPREWGTNVAIVDVEGYDAVVQNKLYDNIGGTYGIIYPTDNFVRNTDSAATTRNYVGDSSVISGRTASVNIASTINLSRPAAYKISQYFPQGSDIPQETYTVNGQQLTSTGSITVTPSGNTSTITIDFGNIPSQSARWLTVEQVNSPEHANLSFTFNE